MYICVILKESKVIKVIPSRWRLNLSNEEGSSKCIPPNEIQKVFYGPNACQDPNFELPLSCNFNRFEDRCYLGFILKEDASEAVCRKYMERRRPIIPVEYFPNRKNGKRNPPNLSQKRKLVTVEQPPQTASIATVKRTRNAAVDRTKTPRQSNDLSPPVIDAVLEQRIENPVPIDEAQHSPRETQNHSVIDQRRSENQPNGDMHMFDAFIDQQVENSVPAAGAQHSRRETQNDVVNRMENTRPNDVLPLPNPEIMQLNHAVGPDMHMHDAVQNPVNISTPPSEQQAEPSPSILSLSQQVEQFKCLVAKKDKQIEIYQSTVKSLNERLGVEDLTVEEQKHYGQILLSSAEGSSDSDDSDGENFDGEPANKENHASNVSNAPQTDMSFSFSHQFVLDKQKTRHYSSVKIDIPNHAVKMLKALNKTKVFKTMVGDGKFIETLLKCVFSANTLKIATFDTLTKPKIAFIKDVFMARLQNAKDGVNRLNHFAELINHVCKKERTQRK